MFYSAIYCVDRLSCFQDCLYSHDLCLLYGCSRSMIMDINELHEAIRHNSVGRKHFSSIMSIAIEV